MRADTTTAINDLAALAARFGGLAEVLEELATAAELGLLTPDEARRRAIDAVSEARGAISR